MTQMIEVKTAELEGLALDWAAGKAVTIGKVKLDDVDGYDDWRISVDDSMREFVRANLGDVVSVPAELAQSKRGGEK